MKDLKPQIIDKRKVCCVSASCFLFFVLALSNNLFNSCEDSYSCNSNQISSQESPSEPFDFNKNFFYPVVKAIRLHYYISNYVSSFRVFTYSVETNKSFSLPIRGPPQVS